MTQPYLVWTAGMLYALATAMLFSRLRADEYAPTGRRVPLLVAAAAVMLHLAYHWSIARALGGPDLHFFAALSLTGLAIAAICILVAWLRPVETIGAIVFPLSMIFLLLDHFIGHPRISPGPGSWQIDLHVIVALTAYATLSIAALVAIMLAVQESALRSHRIGTTMRILPPLTLVEGLLFQLIGGGFILLSLTLVTGALFVEDLFTQHLAHKTILSIGAWLVFGALLYGRWRWGWRGRQAARLTLAGMALLLLAFVGSKFVLELILKRTL